MVEVSSLSLTITRSEKDKGGWWLMTQKDRERKPNIPPPQLPPSAPALVKKKKMHVGRC